MASNRISDYLLLINHQIASQEVLCEYLAKVEAMLEIILAKDLSNVSKEKTYHYLWVISDLISKARVLNDDLLNRLVKITPLLILSDVPTYSMQ